MAENITANTLAVLDPSAWVERYGDYLYRYAIARLRNRELAEEMVQETFLAALAGRDTFTANSSERTWLVSILKHKIVDYFRRKGRAAVANESELGDQVFDQLFDDKGNWRRPPRAGKEPESRLEREEFWAAFRRCLSGLAASLADAFVLREFEELSTEEVCNILNISATNLGVRIHRARMGLWHCLRATWFKSDD
ncbi:MAG: sigma-70 family RNA polymerase sigma factor [Gemmataceae bacterium]